MKKIDKFDPKFDKLLAPRFRVAVKYPESKFRCGSIIKCQLATKPYLKVGCDKYCYQTRRDYYQASFFERYPDVFHPIPFWEERKAEEFPVPFFVRSETNNVFKISSVSKRTDGMPGLFFNDGVHFGGFAIGMTKEMITEKEYSRMKQVKSF